MSSFSIIDPSTTGEISGVISDLPVGVMRVIAQPIRGLPSANFSAVAAPDGNYRIELLPAGDYKLWVYQDLNTDGKYSFGSLDPLMYAERLAVHSDTINVRSRWETGGIDFSFGKSAKVH
jgi:hypothetical protein